MVILGFINPQKSIKRCQNLGLYLETKITVSFLLTFFHKEANRGHTVHHLVVGRYVVGIQENNAPLPPF